MLTTNYVPGVPAWLDFGAEDIEAAKEFYGSLFGWGFWSAGPEAGGYGMFHLDEKIVAAVGPLVEEGARPSWTLYFHTTDADAAAKAVEQAGGTVRVSPFDIFDQGRMAAFTDPEGAQFAVWQPYQRPGLDTVSAQNSLCWTELYTPDVAASKDFYRTVFSWDYQDNTMSDGFTYTIVLPAGGGKETSQSGIIGISEEMRKGGLEPHWQPWFEVADCDAAVSAATSRGGRGLMGPEDVEGVGRIAVVADPFDAVFGVMTSATPEG
ncbi:hydroxylase [Longimycelium tulufanense]|uniref:Hydroxylase n=1 Tax=Longimycelium tulufanense TaxID=907463 RepID=A0A8J3FXA8_9PSEU|nr:VOC family protein [Longimycelium tulufanense]GGM72912.1 hydroxylase [Longimycelium tulufanense]